MHVYLTWLMCQYEENLTAVSFCKAMGLEYCHQCRHHIFPHHRMIHCLVMILVLAQLPYADCLVASQVAAVATVAAGGDSQDSWQWHYHTFSLLSHVSTARSSQRVVVAIGGGWWVMGDGLLFGGFSVRFHIMEPPKSDGVKFDLHCFSLRFAKVIHM